MLLEDDLLKVSTLTPPYKERMGSRLGLTQPQFPVAVPLSRPLPMRTVLMQLTLDSMKPLIMVLLKTRLHHSVQSGQRITEV